MDVVLCSVCTALQHDSEVHAPHHSIGWQRSISGTAWNERSVVCRARISEFYGAASEEHRQ